VVDFSAAGLLGHLPRNQQHPRSWQHLRCWLCWLILTSVVLSVLFSAVLSVLFSAVLSVLFSAGTVQTSADLAWCAQGVPHRFLAYSAPQRFVV